MGEPAATTINSEASSAPGPQFASDSDDLVSTVELSTAMDAGTTPEGGDKPEGDTDAAAAGTDSEGASKSESDDSRFDKHPRFVELNTRMKAAEKANTDLLTSNQTLTQQIAELTKSIKTPKADGEGELPYKDVSKMSEDELLDWQSEDPKGYVDNINKMVEHQIQTGLEAAISKTTEKSEQATLESKIETTYEAYAKENPDFDTMWDSGDISKYMEEHPGHNPLSAHRMLTEDTRIQERVDAAVEKALAEADTQRRSTRKAGSIIPSGPSAASPRAANADDELKNPSKYGGDTAVLAARLARRRQQAGLQ